MMNLLDIPVPIWAIYAGVAIGIAIVVAIILYIIFFGKQEE